MDTATSSERKAGRLSRFNLRFWLIASIIIAVGFGIRMAYHAGEATVGQLRATLDAATAVQAATQARDWSQARRQTQILTPLLASLEETVETFAFIDYVPGMGSAVAEARQMLGDAHRTVQAYGVVTEALVTIEAQAAESLDDTAAREALTRELDRMMPAIGIMTAQTDSLLATYRSSWWHRHWSGAIAIDQLAALQHEFTAYADATRLLYGVVAAKPQATYLLLLQNNTELRPTGGFIGTYGILQVENGSIKEFFLKDIYQLDDNAPVDLAATPPAPLRQHFGRERLYVRDANWEPDFPTAAEDVLALYYAEGGTGRVEGVIALTPDIVLDLLDALGPVTVEGITYDRSNFLDTLQYEVQRGQIEKGKPKEERKDVVNVIGQTLVARLQTLPFGEWTRFDNRIMHNLRRKNLQFHLFDEQLQALAARNGWNGSIRQEVPGDYLFVVDANLGSLKSDPVVARTIAYSVAETEGQMIADVAVTYRHADPTPDWKTSHYRTYTRVYVPAGAELLEVWGAMKDDTQARGPVDTATAYGKTVFGAFVAVNPGETKVLRYRYRLPATIRLEDYSLTLQKQAGNTYTSYEVRVPVSSDHEEIWQGELEEDIVLQPVPVQEF